MEPGQACATCSLRPGCVYTRLFETFIDGEPPPFLRGLPTSPRPFIIELGAGSGLLAPGDPLSFDLVLVGGAVELQGYAVMAVARMAARGLGRNRRRFALEEVHYPDATGAWCLGYSARAPRWPVLAPPARLAHEALGAERLTLRFLTPTRIRIGGRLADRVRFRSLVFAMLRRTLELAHFYGAGGPVDWSFRQLLQEADQIRVGASNLRWLDWHRFSNRQQTRMALGGFVGEMVLEGDLEPFASLLRTAEVIHVGKGATFGLGRVLLET
jgi:hypothetical protein